MTDDLTKQLRFWGGTFGTRAADEIERLREELETAKLERNAAQSMANRTFNQLVRRDKELAATPEQSLARIRNQVREECAAILDDDDDDADLYDLEFHAAAIRAMKEPE